jgi:outer membrane protein TolC
MIADVLDRKNQMRMAKTEIDIARSDYEEKQSELRKIVIQQYNELILRQRLMKLAAKNLETIKINMELAEKEFLNGVIPLTEYTNISAGVANTEAGFENARTGFLNAYMILEEIVGMKFNVVNTIPENK